MKNHIRAVLFSCAAMLLPGALAVMAPSVAVAQDMSAIDRRLNVAVVGFAFNEAAALEALRAGANINHRNPAMDNDSLLIAAVRGFKEPAVIKWLLDHGADPSLTNKLGRTAASYARQYNIGRTPDGRQVMVLLEGAAAGAPAPGGLPQHAPAYTSPPPYTPTVRAAAAPPLRPDIARASTSAAVGGALVPGVYECMNQQAMITPMAFGLIDASTYMSSGGRRGRYSYDAVSATLTLDPGAAPARYRRVGPNVFRPIRENGELGGFTCPLNRAKSPTRLPW